MNTFRYITAVCTVVLFPPAVVYWLIIHPFAAFWRGLGPKWTYWIVGSACIALMVALYVIRTPLLGRDLGSFPMLIIPGAALYAVSVWLTVLTRRQLKTSILVGLPEVSAARAGGTLLDEGIYSVIRHPRYLSVVIGVAAFALFANYAGAYVVAALTLPTLYLVIFFEERELVERFGSSYVEYRQRVPAMIPRSRKHDPRRPTGPEGHSGSANATT